jgi:hypothetical protein
MPDLIQEYLGDGVSVILSPDGCSVKIQYRGHHNLKEIIMDRPALEALNRFMDRNVFDVQMPPTAGPSIGAQT